MNRRDFLKNAGLAAGSAFAMEGLSFGAPHVSEITHDFKTKHLIWIINGNGSRKMDWYENPTLSPNYARLAKSAFVYTNSHNETISHHGMRLGWNSLPSQPLSAFDADVSRRLCTMSARHTAMRLRIIGT